MPAAFSAARAGLTGGKDRWGHSDRCRKRPRGWRSCLAAGHDLRRPEADILRNGIYELRARHERVQYRLLYFFHGKNVAILAHALTKEDTVPAIDIDRALTRKKLFEKHPANHTYTEEGTDEPDSQDA